MSVSKQAIIDPNGPPPNAFCSNVVVSGGTVYLAGCIGIDRDGKLVPGTIRERTTAALERAAERLSLLGLDLSDVVSVQIFLSKYEQDFANMNEAYVAAFPKSVPMPVRTCVGVANLPAGTDIELTIIAAKRT